jgi:coniferyl-aldehyde dehydrogenase
MTLIRDAAIERGGGDWTVEQIEAGLAAQRLAQRRSGPPNLSLRKNRLDRLGAVLSENADAIVRAISADFGNRPLSAALAPEVILQLEEIRSTKSRLAGWMAPRRPQPGYLKLAGVKAWVEPTPLGVVGVIAPWNFPVALAVQPAIAAFAAGNRVMMKMSELTPRTAHLMRRIVAERFDEDEFAVVCGGPDIGAAFSSLPFDHIFFTGSPAVARHVQRAAAANLTPVTLELGGKNPTVLARDADLKKATARIVNSRLANSGQICLSPDHVFVPREKVPAFLAAARSAVSKALPTLLDNDDYASIVNDANYRRVSGLISDAERLGATVHQIIPDGEVFPSPATRKIPFTLLTDVTPEMKVMQEEIFGPVLPVLPYDTLDDVLEFINDQPIPLAAYWFGADSPEFARFVARTRSGGVTRNDFGLHCAMGGLPFGGVGNSGFGYYHGQYGFDTFSHLRAIAVSPDAYSPMSMLTPPFSKALEKSLRTVVKAWGKSFVRRINRWDSA